VLFIHPGRGDRGFTVVPLCPEDKDAPRLRRGLPNSSSRTVMGPGQVEAVKQELVLIAAIAAVVFGLIALSLSVEIP
jgi:hypothetical protein